MLFSIEHEKVPSALEIESEACFDWFHGGESVRFYGELVKEKSALVLRFVNLLGKPSSLLEDARAENRLAATEQGADEVDDFHGRIVWFVG